MKFFVTVIMAGLTCVVSAMHEGDLEDRVLGHVLSCHCGDVTGGCLKCAAMADTNFVAAVQGKIDAFYGSIASESGKDPRVIGDLGFGKSYLRGADYQDLACFVSNNVNQVFMQFNDCATNQLQKYALLCSGWAYGNEYYLDFLDRVVTLTGDGGLSIGYLDWYMTARHDDEKWKTIIRDYASPVVSNLIDKLQLVTGRTNYYNRVRSGEEYRAYLDMHAPRVNFKGGKNE